MASKASKARSATAQPVTERAVAPSSRRRVALTGINTFLGRNIITHLESSQRCEKIVGFDIRPPAAATEKTSFHKVDLTQPNADAMIIEKIKGDGIDTFLHLAFLAAPLHDTTWAHEFEVIGTLHVLTACAEARVPKLVVKSHTMVYGAHPSNPNYLTEGYPLRGCKGNRWIEDKVEAEEQVRRFAAGHPDVVVTTFRTAIMLGPHVRNFMTQLLRKRFVPTAMGYDPLMQFIHETDAMEALKAVVDGDYPGAFNISGRDVLPFSTILKLTGRIGIPLLHLAAGPLFNLLWVTQLFSFPPGFFDCLRFPVVADGTKAEKLIGFRPRYTTRETVLSFAATLEPGRLKDRASSDTTG